MLSAIASAIDCTVSYVARSPTALCIAAAITGIGNSQSDSLDHDVPVGTVALNASAAARSIDEALDACRSAAGHNSRSTGMTSFRRRPRGVELSTLVGSSHHFTFADRQISSNEILST